ncbi:MAG TPA: hypothetical protein VFA98_15560 [Thermoanaerobaculia bacterium]|nr:hypothetical protein [Thermoanaerobaculia bacterium]
MGKKVNGKWVYRIPKAIYVELWGDKPTGDPCLTRRECIENGIGGKVVKFVPAAKDRTYVGGDVVETGDESEESE